MALFLSVLIGLLTRLERSAPCDEQMHQSRPPSLRCPQCSGEHLLRCLRQPLLVQCLACGCWTSEHSRVCPTCGKALGPSFAQKQERETLHWTLSDLERRQRESTRQWLTARRKERRTIVRLLTVGMLARITSGLSLSDLVLLRLSHGKCSSSSPLAAVEPRCIPSQRAR